MYQDMHWEGARQESRQISPSIVLLITACVPSVHCCQLKLSYESSSPYLRMSRAWKTHLITKSESDSVPICSSFETSNTLKRLTRPALHARHLCVHVGGNETWVRPGHARHSAFVIDCKYENYPSILPESFEHYSKQTEWDFASLNWTLCIQSSSHSYTKKWGISLKKQAGFHIAPYQTQREPVVNMTKLDAQYELLFTREMNSIYCMLH